MTRNEEYQALLQELETTPAALDGAVERALRRRKRDRRLRLFGVPAGSLAACFAAFVLLVNLFPPFARACGSVPVLRELAQAVAWSPSLSAAVENDYVQPIGQSQTVNGVTATVDEINEFCKALPRYKRPREIIFDVVPRNPTGKIEKPKLREKYGSTSLVALQTGDKPISD